MNLRRFLSDVNCSRVGVIVFEGCDDERRVFLWHVKFHA